jgi:hypothetical protein
MFAQTPFKRRAGGYTSSIQTVQESAKRERFDQHESIQQRSAQLKNIVRYRRMRHPLCLSSGLCRGPNRIQTLEALTK